jgi:hypothetical protein
MPQIPTPLAAPVPLLSADAGQAYRPHHVLNELAAWLEPRRLDAATADLIQHLYETALELLDDTDRNQLSAAARRWTRETRWPQQRHHPTLPFD